MNLFSILCLPQLSGLVLRDRINGRDYEIMVPMEFDERKKDHFPIIQARDRRYAEWYAAHAARENPGKQFLVCESRLLVQAQLPEDLQIVRSRIDERGVIPE